MSNILRTWTDKTSVLEEKIKTKYNVFFNNYLKGTAEFFESDSIFVKLAFLLLAIIMFYIILLLGLRIIQSINSKDATVKVVDGLVNLRSTSYEVLQDPNNKASRTIYRSEDDDLGIEFTWSVWLFIKKNNTKSAKPTPIFYKGKKLSTLYHTPGLYLDNNTNALIVKLNTYNLESNSVGFDEVIKIDESVLNKWVNVIIRVNQKEVDVYINGILTKNLKLKNIPYQNYENIQIGDSENSLDGYLSNLTYYNTSLGTKSILDVYTEGPSLKIDKNLDKSTQDSALAKNPYLSINWYFNPNKINDYVASS